MGKLLELGRRLEIHSMDKHCHDISVALYRQDMECPQFLVHTYSESEESATRVRFIRQALIRMIGLEPADRPNWLQFPCRKIHQRALKRTFLDLCKLETEAPLEAKSLEAFDKKAAGNLRVVSMGDGAYRTEAVEETEAGQKRSRALARGFAKLCELRADDADPLRFTFECQSSHDSLVGMLMFRAQNVRSSMQEEDAAAGRGVLAPPSQQ
ncbi:MAG: hypothetical protein MK102_06000 [Fuerstiella sp.]|nr:hypothetical protein [Fuerstiella sp.]